jgi:predicted transcriptional regulator
MEEYVTKALEIVKAQAGVRTMSEEEMTSMVFALAREIRDIVEGTEDTAPPEADLEEAKKAIKEKSVTCMECGKSFRILTRRHLATHDLTPEEYREKWGYKKGTSLVAKSLARERRKKMLEMQLWKKRKK